MASFATKGTTPIETSIASWNVSNVTDMYRMFEGIGFGNPDITNWNTQSVQNFQRFMQSSGHFNRNLSSWNTSSATNMSAMFGYDRAQPGNISSWDIDQVTNFANFMTNNLTALSTADYDAVLIGWENQLQTAYPGGVGYTPIININFGVSTYTLGSAAEAARTSLISTYGWTITDGGGVAQAPFVFTVNALNFTIPINATYTYNYDISTSDGQVITGNTGGTTINFPSSGVYDIEITGTFPAIQFNNGGSRVQITDIKSWGAIEWKSFLNAFLGCVNMTCTATDRPYLFTPINFQGAFQNCVLFNPPSISSWDVSNVTSFYNTFSGARSFNQDISGWNVSNVQSFRSMFFNSTTNNMAFNQPIGSWDVSGTVGSNVFRAMLYGCNNFDQDLSAWDISGLPYSTGNFSTFITSGDLVNFPVGLSRDNYDALLIGWAAQAPTQGEIISFGTSQYTLGGAAEAARNTLVNTYNWTITDGGGVAPAVTYTTNLVASYNFDSDFSDYTGNNNLTRSGTTPPTPGVAGGIVSNCAEFNSTGDYTLAADSNDLSFTDGVNDLPFSVSFWANFTSYDASSIGGAWFLSKRDASTNEEYQIMSYQNELAFVLFSGGGNASFLNARIAYPPPIGSWHHYTFTYDGSATFAGLKIYIDGVSQSLTNSSVGTYTGMINGTRAVNIGSRSWQPSNGSFWGKMDEYHIWKNRELTAAEVLDIYNTENAGNSILPAPASFLTNLVASYNFEADFTDYTGVNNGTAQGTPVAGNPGGIVGNDLLNNSGSYVNMGNDVSLQANKMTISAWFKTSTSNSSYRGIVIKQYAYGFFLSNNILGMYDWTSSQFNSTGLVLNDGNWHHACVVMDNGVTNGTKIYVDGVLGATFTHTIFTSQSSPLTVGTGGPTTTQYFDGEIDEVHVWTNRLLSAAEVLDIYNTENAGNSILP